MTVTQLIDHLNRLVDIGGLNADGEVIARTRGGLLLDIVALDPTDDNSGFEIVIGDGAEGDDIVHA